MSSTTKSSVPLLASLTFFSLPIVILQCYNHYKKKLQEKKEIEKRQNKRNLSMLSKLRDSLKPPLPPVVQKLLSQCRLAYLSTVDSTSQSSHLSLMRFTYLKDEEVIIMSTNTQTKKFTMIQEQRGVALLVHDFGTGDVASGEYSITLNGQCSIVDDKETAERYRAAHLRHNPDYPQFIVGDDVAILCVNVSSARICNIDDRVLKWNVESPEALSS